MAAPDLVVRNASLFGRPVDLFVRQGLVMDLTEHDPDLDSESELLEANGQVLLPSLIDAHVHLREPGQEYKEDIASGLAAAAHGGFGQVLAMANTSPVNDDATVTTMMLTQAGLTHPNGPYLRPVGGLTTNLKAEELSPLAELAEAGCVAFSNDGMPVRSSELFRRAIEYASDTGRIVIDHAEDPDMAPGAGMNEGELSGRLGLKASPWCAEAIQISRDVMLAEFLGVPIHIAHVSSMHSVALIRWAKNRGVPVTAETCPHYLFFTEEAVRNYSTLAKVNPPLRTAADQKALRKALADGTIDIIATDHAPHADHEKETEFMAAPCGISGLDTALALTWKLVADGTLTQERFAEAWAFGPAAIFGLPVNRFAPGDPADFILFDPDAGWTVTPETMRSKGKNTPCLDMALHGKVTAHYLNGVRIV
jgi:dihydroorotase